MERALHLPSTFEQPQLLLRERGLQRRRLRLEVDREGRREEWAGVTRTGGPKGGGCKHLEVQGLGGAARVECHQLQRRGDLVADDLQKLRQRGGGKGGG